MPNRKMSRLKAFHVVYARWCPHCVPTTVEPMKRAAEEIGLPCVLYDIDTEDEEMADDLVRKYGDWSDDYLIPQVFFEYDDGEFKHVLTGRPEGVEFTKRALVDLLHKTLKERRPASRGIYSQLHPGSEMMLP